MQKWAVFSSWNINEFEKYSLYGGPKVSRQFQFYSRQFQFAHGSFNFTHGNFNFTHGDFNILTAISQFRNFTQGNFNFFHGNAHGIFRFSHHLSATAATKSQNAKSKVDSKVDLQREKWKSQSKVDLRTSRTRGYLHETGTNSDWYEFVSVSIDTFPDFLFMRLPT